MTRPPPGRSSSSWTTAPATSCRSTRRYAPPARTCAWRRAATRSTARTCSSSRASGPPRPRWSASAPAASSSRSRLGRGGPPVPRHLPRAPAPVRGLGRGRRRDAGRPARPDRAPRGRPDAPAHRLEPGRPPPRAPGLRGHRRGRGLLLRPLLRRAAGAGTPPTRSSPRPSTAPGSCPRSRAAGCSASSSTPSGPATTACA